MKEKKRSLPAIRKDPDDAPSLDAAFFESAELFDGASPKPRGRPSLRNDPESLQGVWRKTDINHRLTNA
jgi:hypothetical protein